MFKRQTTKPTPPPAADDQEQVLQRELHDLRRQNAEYRETMHATQQTFLQISEALREIERNAPLTARTTLRALVNLELETLGSLPLELIERRNEAATELERFVHRPAGDYISPARAAAELLAYRTHTALHILGKIIRGESVSPSDVTYQANHDLQVLNNHERRRHEQRIEERRRNSGTPTDK